MKTVFYVSETRRVRSPFTGKNYTFTKGELTTAARISKAFIKRPNWIHELSKIEAQAMISNRLVDKLNKQDTILSEEESYQVAEVTQELLELGLDRSEFAFGHQEFRSFKGTDKDEALWVFVKVANAGDVLVGHNHKPVTLTHGNAVAINTFLRRFQNNQTIFSKDI